jgi:hypothetical protein
MPLLSALAPDANFGARGGTPSGDSWRPSAGRKISAMDDFEQLGVTVTAETPPSASPARDLSQIIAVVVAGVLLTAVAIVALAAGAGAITSFLNTVTSIH